MCEAPAFSMIKLLYVHHHVFRQCNKVMLREVWHFWIITENDYLALYIILCVTILFITKCVMVDNMCSILYTTLDIQHTNASINIFDNQLLQ